MAKYSGLIGFADGQVEEDGVVTVKYSEIKLRGDVLNSGYNYQNDSKKYDSITVSNQLSLIASDAICNNCSNLRYAYFAGQKWKIISFEIKRPRLIVRLGDVWNGEEASS